ncbi:MAG: TolC family protein [Burkholderiales bacterium]
MRVVPIRAGVRRLCTLIQLTACLAGVQAVHAAETPLQFNEALQIAEQHSARLVAQEAAVAAVGEQVTRAKELPDPKLRFGIENLPVSDPDAFSFTRDFMTMRRIGYMQEMPNAAKREARGERAAREQAVESANLAAQRAQVRQDVAVAWLELHYAQSSERALQQLVSAYAVDAESTGPAVSAGRMSPAAAVAARGAVESARDRLLEQQRNVARARAVLGGLLGNAAERPLGAPPDINALAHAPGALVSGIEAHPAQRIYEEREALAASEVNLATSTRKPDWSWEISFGQREPSFSTMVSVMISMDLPVRKGARQDRDVAMRAKQLEQARAQREDARRMHEAEVRALIADWQFAGERARRLADNVAPLARERSELALAGYRGGRGELSGVLESRRAETEVQLARFSAELERARAWARLNFLLQHGGEQ